MAAVDNKLRLSIVTALDNAGIKATEQQIDGLAKSIQKVNKEADSTKMENAIGDLGGKLGKIGKSLSGMPAKIALIVGAFQTGWEIGTKFFDVVIKGWFGWEDAITKLKKSNRALQKEMLATATSLDAAMSKGEIYQDRQISKIDAAIQRINAQTQAYTRLSKAKSDFDNSGADMETQKLERERFEDMLALQANGEYDRAEQVSKIYDVYRQELEAKKQMANYDEETLRQEEQRAAKEQEAYKWLEKIDKLSDQKKYWQEKLDTIQSDTSINLSQKDYDKLEAKALRKIGAIDKQLDAAEAQAQKYMADIDEGDWQSLTRERNRATLADKLNLDRDKLLWSYGQAVQQSGTDYGFKFSNDYIKQSYQSSMDSYTELKSIKDNTEDLAAKLD